MDINYESELVSYWMITHSYAKKLINTQKMVGDYEEARLTALRFQSQAVGATEQMVYMLSRNRMSDTAEKILDRWEMEWSKNFQDLMKD